LVGSLLPNDRLHKLFYTPGQSIITTHNANYNLFQNFQSVTITYWSSTEYVPDTGAWGFLFYGLQDAATKSTSLYALAVRPGDVTAVPLPSALWLFSSGLLALLSLARRHGAERGK
jgi:hypothetical protein